MTRGKTSALDFAASGGTPTSKGHHQRASPPMQINTNEEQCGSASEDNTADKADGNQADGAEADDEDGSAGEPDVLAPSDSNFAFDKGQTGLHQGSKSLKEPRNIDCAGEEDSISDEDDYNGVDLISESGDEEPTVEHIEEKAIIDSEENNSAHPRLMSQPNSPSDAFFFNAADLENLDFDMDPFLTDEPFFEDRWAFSIQMNARTMSSTMDLPTAIDLRLR